MAFDNIKLEKGLYTTGKSFTNALEDLDPSENYVGTPLEGLDAYERQLKRFDIKVSGVNSDPVSKFFATTDSAALFPEYVSRAVKLGVESNNRIEKIVATTTEIDSLDYRSISCNDMDYYLQEVAQGSTIPEFTISLNDKLTKLKKHGRMLVASYEAIKYQKLDLFTTMLKKIGDSIAESEFKQAISNLSENEGFNSKTLSTASYTYKDLVKLWADFLPYHLNSLVVSPGTFAEILSLPEVCESAAGSEFCSTGKMISPLGINLFCCGDVDDSKALGFDKNYAIEKVQAGGVITEFDKLIDRQLERATISTIVGFTTIYNDAISEILRGE